ncbi:uncharacterized protein BDZ99DRAFT_465035 [Mytilinidion resinicola]|uniref:Eukaryotic mitochondrial regulator protein-domain-containing protein n=1 Tax=Mytilinidion resinicola TaxID=574789 RepID=A0A6A6YE59_9PEZI|nr:uncharacterized protein BDZ99DRAFT_465035 [Mytilinidion resinicola]KAF2807101.1 hypothetical protein BDZ99DRAFT_465035 [Mytilinidion resinicola]
MPPRLRPRISLLPSGPTPTSRPQCLLRPSPSHRHFSQTTPHYEKATRMRRNMYKWINGPGKVFLEPLPGSTNYMSAYDKDGNLLRARKGGDEESTPGSEEAKALEEGKQAEDGSEKPKSSEEELENLDEAAVAKKEEDAKKEQIAKSIPPEGKQDLQPFPLNAQFVSQPVLSEELREAIWKRVMKDGVSLPTVSVEFGVSNERVGAVVRLMQMEKEWVAKGKKLVRPYAEAVMAMLPKTPYVAKGENKRPVNHESINDLIVHPATKQQLFVPVSESRHFTREDAAKAFHHTLLSADDRIPHPELVVSEREAQLGLSNSERVAAASARMLVERQRKAEKEAKRKEWEAKTIMRVPGRRWDFVFQDISVESVGKDGRSEKGVGWRYGIPHEDRKRGQVKIPTKVDG